MLVGSNSDLGTLQAVPTEDAKEFAKMGNLFFMETSLESTNVETSFVTVLTEIYRVVTKKSLVANDESKSGGGARFSRVPRLLSPQVEQCGKGVSCCTSS
ncbi:hypothetical protein Patl1_17247 [Pistacia atlantica]|uniref:Uncharacterized protein n=1 Tax=Pistacia atlantica TaxID=434234 RepID=A0ACC1BAP2_9ROSI|nr:hypothetical protein Patl1_17247 [Pistacia atlantica]